MLKDHVTSKFYEALESNNMKSMASIPKSDVHNHAGRGGHIKDLSTEIIPPAEPFNNLDEMQRWFEKNVKARCGAGVEGYLYRVEASFKQAARDNIKKFALSFGSGEVDALGGIHNFIETMNMYKEKHIPHSEFIPELSLLRGHITANEVSEMKELISYGWFKALDVCGDELKAPVDNYKPLYRYAKSKELILKMHVGEFGSAQDVRRAVEVLELDELHHGIAASRSDSIMRYLAEHKIILNICPTSNVMLKRVESYVDHPIKKLYEAGVLVTINTDDLAIFNATVSEEYMTLYNKAIFTKEELNEIRVGGLTGYGRYRDT